MVKSIEKVEFIKRLDEVLSDVKNNGNTYIICVNTIPFVKVSPLDTKEIEHCFGVSYESASLVGITEDY